MPSAILRRWMLTAAWSTSGASRSRMSASALARAASEFLGIGSVVALELHGRVRVRVGGLPDRSGPHELVHDPIDRVLRLGRDVLVRRPPSSGQRARQGVQVAGESRDGRQRKPRADPADAPRRQTPGRVAEEVRTSERA